MPEYVSRQISNPYSQLNKPLCLLILPFINPPQNYLSANLLTTLYLCSSWLCTHFHQKPQNPQQQSSCPTYQREYTSSISGIAQRYQSQPVNMPWWKCGPVIVYFHCSCDITSRHMYSFNNQCSPHIESSWLIYFANEMTHLDIMGTLVIKEINKIYFREKGIKKAFKIIKGY